MSAFYDALERHSILIRPLGISVLQVNITRRCNQACRHCHVNASPARTEEMDDKTIERCLAVLRAHEEISVLDITGGAPELHPRFEHLVSRATDIGKHVIVRHNLTVSADAFKYVGRDMTYLPRFFADNGVELMASLPCYGHKNVDAQRGEGVFDKSIAALCNLNEIGYGVTGTGLILNLVYNPSNAVLPGLQASLEEAYRSELLKSYGINFNHLYTMANVPINRFADQLAADGCSEEYAKLLRKEFNPKAAEHVMCRCQINVGYDGRLFDCDFNQMLEMGVGIESSATIDSFDYDTLMKRQIRCAEHCFVCTAGTGSSCSGQIT
ncbi:MAG: arsenosugar biosynthesis radical SAM (seleno)protein ArsS [Actinomycetota bacterium]